MPGSFGTGDTNVVITILNNYQQIQDSSKSAIELLGDGISLVSNISGVLGLPSAVISLLQLLNNQPTTDDLIKGIQQQLDAVLHFQVTHDEEEHMFHIADLVGPAATRWRTLNEVNFNFDNSLVNISEFNQDIQNAAMSLALNDVYWRRPFYEDLVFDDNKFIVFRPGSVPAVPWMGRADPPDVVSSAPGLAQVFDYRLALPSFLCAVKIRCAFVLALRALKPDVETAAVYQNFLTQELPSILGRLSHVYETITRGFVVTVNPLVNGDPGHWTWERWMAQFCPVAVIDRCSGGGIYHIWDLPTNLSHLENARLWDAAVAKIFDALWALTIRAYRVRLYVATGMPAVWTSMQALKRLAGQPTQDIDPQFPGVTSTREVLGIVEQAVGTLGRPISLRRLLVQMNALATMFIPNNGTLGNRWSYSRVLEITQLATHHPDNARGLM
jgi:hypothetical protein